MIGDTHSSVTPDGIRGSDLENQNEKRRDNASDLTKEEVTFTEDLDITEESDGSIDKNTIARSKESSVFRLKEALKELNSMESNPREFSPPKKRLILMTVALASSM